MRINNYSIAKRAKLLLITILSCAQITLGFFLITDKSDDINTAINKNIIKLAQK